MSQPKRLCRTIIRRYTEEYFFIGVIGTHFIDQKKCCLCATAINNSFVKQLGMLYKKYHKSPE
jgi:hypothetical protein